MAFGMGIAILSLVMDHRLKEKKAVESSKINEIISAEDIPLDQLVKQVLQMQVEQQKKDKWTERIIGFLMGLASSLIGSLIFYLING